MPIYDDILHQNEEKLLAVCVSKLLLFYSLQHLLPMQPTSQLVYFHSAYITACIGLTTLLVSVYSWLTEVEEEISDTVVRPGD